MGEYCEFHKKDGDYCKVLKDECAVAYMSRSGCGVRLNELKKRKR